MASAEKMEVENDTELMGNDDMQHKSNDKYAVNNEQDIIDLDVVESNDSEVQQAVAHNSSKDDDADSNVAIIIAEDDEDNNDLHGNDDYFDGAEANDNKEGKSENDTTEQDDVINSIEIVDSPVSPKEEDKHETDLVVPDTTLDNAMVVVNEHDPLDLLMPLKRSGQNASPHNGTDDDESDADSGSGSVSSDRLTREERWLLWQKQYDWLLHDTTSGDFAYCLYCDVTVHVGSQRYVKQHNLSLYHSEREKNYLAFKAYREELNESLGLVEIKQEYGTDDRIAALKLHRVAQAEALNNFNWLRWMEAHEWLVRENDEGTIGYCKYCKTRLNVEFSYLRERHAKSKGHMDLEQAYKKREVQKQTKPQSEQTSGKRKGSTEAQTEGEVDDNPNEEQSNAGDNDEESTEMSSCEVVPQTSDIGNGDTIYCKACDTTITRQNFRRHLRSKIHISNMENNGGGKPRPIKEETNVPTGFEKYVKQHPWITVDLDDANNGYCTVCQKRILYPHSEAKRILHENSLAHRTALEEINKKEKESVDDKDSSDKDDSSSSDNDSDSEDDNDDDDEEKSVKQSTTTKSKRPGPIPKKVPWYKPYGKDPSKIVCTYCNIVIHVSSRTKHNKTQKHLIEAKNHAKSYNRSKQMYHWLGFTQNKKISYCKYCHVRFTTTQARASHARSNRHMLAMKQLLTKQANKKKQNRVEHKSSESSENGSEEIAEETPTATQKATVVNTPAVIKTSVKTDKQKNTFSIHAIVQKWNNRFPWLTFKRAETRPHYGWCKLCETSFYVPSYKFICKHQRSGRHIRVYRQWKRGTAEKKTNTTEKDENVAETSETKESPVKNKVEANASEIFEQYSWCEPHANDATYVNCRICKIRLTAKLFMVRQHDGSKRHSENVRLLAELNKSNEAGKNNENNEDEDEDEENMQQQNQNMQNNADEEEEESDEMSVRADSSTYKAVRNFVKRAQHFDSEEGNEPKAKRSRHSSNAFENLNEDTRQKLVRALLRLKSSQRQREETSPLLLAQGIISSSFNIAACLTPLIQQQQQQNSLNKTAAADVNKTTDIPATEPPPKRDTIDLFFDSIMHTIRNLPADLVTEAKCKIMQLVCELELRALNRQKETENKFQESNEENSMPTNIFNNNANAIVTATQKNTTPSPPINKINTTAIRASPSPESDDAIIIDDFEELIRLDTNLSPYTTITNVSTNTPMVRTPTGRYVQLPNGNHKTNNNNNNNNSSSSNSGTINQKMNNDLLGTTTTTKQRSANDVATPANILRMPASTTVQISTRNETTGSVRCVPLNTLTALVKSPENTNVMQQPVKTTPVVSRLGGSMNQNNTTIQASSSNINATSTPRPNIVRRSSICSVTPRADSNDSLQFRHIRVNTSTQSKYITIQNPSGTTMAPTSGPTQMRLSNGSVQHIRPIAK